MLTRVRWATLGLAIGAACSWAAVSGIRVAYESPSLAAHGSPRRYSDYTIIDYATPEFIARNAASLRRADVALRVTAALLISVHLVSLNLSRSQR
jgi:hypothetical protein